VDESLHADAAHQNHRRYFALGTTVGAAALTYGGTVGQFAFYSGPGAQAAATTWAEENEGVTIWGTEYGAAFNDGLGTAQEVSAEYAQNVYGEVHIFSTIRSRITITIYCIQLSCLSCIAIRISQN
jgi:hypothetical protein